MFANSCVRPQLEQDTSNTSTHRTQVECKACMKYAIFWTVDSEGITHRSRQSRIKKRTLPSNWPVRKPLLKFDLTQKGGCRLRRMERSHSPTPIAYANRVNKPSNQRSGRRRPYKASTNGAPPSIWTDPDSFRPGSRSTCSLVVRFFSTESRVFSSLSQGNLRRSTRQRSRSSARIRVGGRVFRSRRRIRAPGRDLFSGFRAPRSVLYFKDGSPSAP